MTLICDGFDALVDVHFKKREWSLDWMRIRRAVRGNGAQIVNRFGKRLPIPQGPMPDKVISFNYIQIRSTLKKKTTPRKTKKLEDEMSPLCSFDDFKDVRDIGTGAFARVFHGVEPPSNRNVALKRINLTELDTDSVLYASVKNEVNILKSLSHPNIVKYFYSFEEVRQSVKYVVLVLEYVNGGDLEKWLKRKTNNHRLLLPEADIWRVFTQIADAVQYIHTKRIRNSFYVLSVRTKNVFDNIDPRVLQSIATALLSVKYVVLVLEYVNGGDLEKWLKRKTNNHRLLLPEADIWRVFTQIADAVQYIHTKRIIHRDLKPPNMLLTTEDIVKLADFGLSRQQTAESFAETGCGTPYYMSPERILKESYTTKADIWSLGCILYEMATLCSPFFGEKNNISSLKQKIRGAEYPPLPDRCCYTEQLELLVQLCLNPMHSARPSAVYVHRMAAKMAGHWGVGGGGATTSK
uniref:non-specific serine/threonine protein kinase n=1 Tax=Globodera pallida TaxID=36090 RepID=A0A183BK05_GLOPA